MVILVGQATRLAQFLDKDEKEYEALVRFGFETDTGDRTGTRRGDAETPRRSDIVTKQEIEDTLDSFRGEIEQVPPMYSAKKIDGKKLYEHARKGETVERKAIEVTISELEMLPPRPAAYDERVGELKTHGIRVVCSAGTYIRTLAEDIGREIGTGAHLAELRRTRAGKFTIGQSLTLEQVEDLEDQSSALIAMHEAVSHLPPIDLDDDRITKTRSGLSTRIGATQLNDGEMVQMTDSIGNLIAIGIYNEAENSVQPKVVLV